MNKITEITRRDIFDLFVYGLPQAGDEIEYINYHGALDEVTFLSRLYKLDEMESFDHRYDNAFADISIHLHWGDYEKNWVFNDKRFNLFYCNDDELLNFLCESFNPVVRCKDSSWEILLSEINSLLSIDGYEIYASRYISGRAVYSWKSIEELDQYKKFKLTTIKERFDIVYIREQLDVLLKDNQLPTTDVIGKSKDLLESCCKIILDEKNIAYLKNDDLQKLFMNACGSLSLTPNSIDINHPVANIAKKILGSLATVTQGMAELRNNYGTGHGKSKKFIPLPRRYANLALNSTITAIMFLIETYDDRKDEKND